MIKKALLIGVCAALLPLGGCAEFDSVFGSTSTLTTQQKVVLAATLINDACVITASGLAFAGGVNAIVHPNATTGGSGASTAGTITKASSIDALSCQSLNGVTATLVGTTTAGTATVSVAQ